MHSQDLTYDRLNIGRLTPERVILVAFGGRLAYKLPFYAHKGQDKLIIMRSHKIDKEYL